MEKQKLLQQQHIFTCQKKCTTTQNKHKKTKARFSRLLWHPAWKWSGPILDSALHKFVTYLLTYSRRPTRSHQPVLGLSVLPLKDTLQTFFYRPDACHATNSNDAINAWVAKLLAIFTWLTASLWLRKVIVFTATKKQSSYSISLTYIHTCIYLSK